MTNLLIHDVVIAPDTLSKSDSKYAIFEHHTSPEQVSKVFNEVKPKLAVYSHIVKLYGRNENELIKRTRANYSGLVMIGEDLMSFTIDDTVSINEWRNKKKEQ